MMNAASAPSMPFAITVGKGRQNAQGSYLQVANTVEAVASALQSQPSELERWWSAHLWMNNKRSGANWLASVGVGVDVDYNVKEAAPPDELRAKLEEAVAGGKLAANIFHLTPHGARFVFVYERPCSDRDVQVSAERGAGRIIEAFLREQGITGYHVDRPILGDLARFFYTPTSIAKGVTRQAEVRVVNAEPFDPIDLAHEDRVDEPEPQKPVATPTPISSDLASAVERWNRDHAQDWPRSSGDCPVCGHRDCFGTLPEDSSRWFCWSTDHRGVGIQSDRGWHGDALDLEAYTRGEKPADVLRADGYLATKKQETSEQRAAQESPEAIFADLIELGEALTPELIALQKEPLSTGIVEIDDRLGGGYFCGELIVVQASTGVGKTSYNLFTQCTGVASDPQRSGLYITTEMQPHELQARRACQVLNEQGIICNWRQVLNGTVPLERTREATRNTRVHVLKQRPSETPVERIRVAALKLAEKYGKPPLIIADYLQALSLGIKEDRRIAVGTTIYALQELAVELQTPVVAISSISRSGNTKDKRESDDPYEFLNIAKEAGEIEFAASVLCHLDVKADTDEQGWRAARFILAKSRFGSPGILGMRFHGSSGRFEACQSSTFSTFDYEVLERVHAGTFPSANAVAKAMGKNRPKTMDAVRRLQFAKAILTVGGYLKVDPKIAASLGAE